MFKYFNDREISVVPKKYLRPSLQFLNAVGGSVVLDCLSDDEIAKIMIDKIEEIRLNEKDDVSKTKLADSKSVANVGNKETVKNNVSSEKIVKGNTVKARCLETDDVSNYIVDYISGTNKIPPLAKMFLDCVIGDVVEFKGKSYKVEEIL